MQMSVYALSLLFAIGFMDSSKINLGRISEFYWKGGMYMTKKTCACANVDKPSVSYVYTAYITRNGKRIYAKSYGLKAFRIAVPTKKS